MAFQSTGRNRKHASEKVTLTAQVNTALCKSTSQLSGDTHWQSERPKRGCEHCRHINVFSGSAPGWRLDTEEHGKRF